MVIGAHMILPSLNASSSGDARALWVKAPPLLCGVWSGCLVLLISIPLSMTRPAVMLERSLTCLPSRSYAIHWRWPPGTVMYRCPLAPPKTLHVDSTMSRYTVAFSSVCEKNIYSLTCVHKDTHLFIRVHTNLRECGGDFLY